MKKSNKTIIIAAAVAAALVPACKHSENKPADTEAEVVETVVEDPGEAYLKKNGTREGVVTRPSGLQYEVIQQGEGEHPTAASTVTVAYEGRLIDGTVFDSSIERGEPATFAVGQVIPGWVEGLQMMQEGATWQLTIPSELAYGNHGTGPIQPNSTLIFDVKLLKVQHNK